ncbi:MAG: ASKHA domain-containing protein [Isosphaeraceae bacterium]
MSSEPVRLEPGPDGSLRDLLFERGVEFPCGGTTLCGGCKIRIVAGEVPVTPEMSLVLSRQEIERGWRLGCLAVARDPVVVEVAQWSSVILDDQDRTPFEPAEGLGAVVDLGTTTLVAQAVDLSSGEVVAVATALNPQARHGADLMARLDFERAHPGELTSLIRDAVGRLLAEVAIGRPLAETLIVGNTVMHHLLAGRSIEPLCAVPFRSPHGGEAILGADELRWKLELTNPVRMLPCLGGFVGSDILAGLVATGLHLPHSTGALLDLGTNGEIAVADDTGIVCASAAAGPAFEGGRIGQGQRAGRGAIDRVCLREGRLECRVIGGTPARGICGSGLVDAIACARHLGSIQPSGRLSPGVARITLTDSVSLSQADLRELQLAKAAIAAGFDILRADRPIEPSRVFLAGAFGNYVNPGSARRIGLLPQWADRPTPAGNTALRGARTLLLAGARRDALIEAVLSRTRHLELASDPTFQEAFVAAMAFPATEEFTPLV